MQAVQLTCSGAKSRPLTPPSGKASRRTLGSPHRPRTQGAATFARRCWNCPRTSAPSCCRFHQVCGISCFHPCGLWKTRLWSSWTLITLIPLAWGRWGRASLLYRWPLERKCWKSEPALVFVQFETGYQLVWSLYPQLVYFPLGFKNAYINLPQPLCLLQWKICWFVWTLKSQRQMFLSL